MLKAITDNDRIEFIIRHVEHWYNVPNRTPIMDPERQANQQCFLCVTPYKRQSDDPDLRRLLLRVLDDSIRVERGEMPLGYAYVPPFKLLVAHWGLPFKVATCLMVMLAPILTGAWWLGWLS